LRFKNTKDQWDKELFLQKGKQNRQTLRLRREKTQVSNIRYEKGNITTYNIEIQKIIRNYKEQLYVNKFEDLDKKSKFLDKCTLTRLNHEELENLNRSIISKNIKSVIKSLPSKKCPG
jgi:hypothetical protein